MNASILPDRIATAALLLMLVLPFANPIHTAPIPSFYSEWLAAALALIVIAAILVRCALERQSLAVPGIAALPLLLAFANVIHAILGHAAHPRQALLASSVLIMAAATMVAGRTMSEASRSERRTPWLARFLAAGSLLQCLVLGLQTARIHVPWLVFLPAAGAPPTGSLGQANHLVDYLWLGIVSIIYLMARRGRLSVSGSLLVLVLAAVSTLPASRSAMLYPVGLALLALLAWRATPNANPWRPVALLCLTTIPVMLAADRLHKYTAEGLTSTATLSLTDRLANSGGDDIRSGLYRVAFAEALARPLVGHGVGATPWVTFQRADRWPEGSIPVVAEHVHNIELQWLLEYGLPLTALALGLVLRWLWLVLPNADEASQWWALSILAVIGIHSQLEYPLWLIYFLLPSCWLMGAASPAATWRLPGTQSLVGGLMLALGAATLGSLWPDYRELERIQAAAKDPRQWALATTAAVELDRSSLLAPNALVFLVGGMEVTGEQMDHRWDLCRQALRVSPRPEIADRCAKVAALAGHTEDSERLTRLIKQWGDK